MLQQQNRKGHPYTIIIEDLIKAIKEKQKEKYEIILTTDGNRSL